MVRTFSWYRCIVPWDPENNINVNDWATQCYLHDTRNKRSQDSRGVYFDWGAMCTEAFNSTPYAILKINGWTPYFCEYWQDEQNYTYQKNHLGFEAIVDGVYTDANAGLNFVNPTLYNQYDVFWFLNP